jgi:hypothetical protein
MLLPSKIHFMYHISVLSLGNPWLGFLVTECMSVPRQDV